MKKCKFMDEFKKFITKGNVADMAVGIIIGGAFQKIVTSFVNDLVMPIVGLFTGGVNFNDQFAILRLPEGVDAKYLSDSLKQNDIQVLVNNLYETVLTITGLPNRNGGSSTSDTGSAVIMRDGWENAEAQMKSVENEFKLSEKEFLKLILRNCCRTGMCRTILFLTKK